MCRTVAATLIWLVLALAWGLVFPAAPPTAAIPYDFLAITDQPFTLGIGRTAYLAAEDLTITLVEVRDDSRCPANTVCVWAGQVTVELALARRSGPARRLVLTGFPTPEHPLTQASGPLTIRVLAVNPYPSVGAPFPPDDYQVTLIVGGER